MDQMLGTFVYTDIDTARFGSFSFPLRTWWRRGDPRWALRTGDHVKKGGKEILKDWTGPSEQIRERAVRGAQAPLTVHPSFRGREAPGRTEKKQ